MEKNIWWLYAILNDVNNQFDTQNTDCTKADLMVWIPSLRGSNRIGDVVVSILASSAENRGFESRSGQTKD